MVILPHRRKAFRTVLPTTVNPIHPPDPGGGDQQLPDSTATDPYFNYTKLLLHCNGEDGATSFTDSSGVPKTVTTVGDAKVSTSVTKFGGGSLQLDGNDYLSVPSSSDFNFGTENFTIEAWIYPTSSAARTIMSKWTAAGSLVWYLGGGGTSMGFYFSTAGNNTVYTIPLTSWPALNEWMHIAVCRDGASIRMFINGVQYGSTYTTGASTALFNGTGVVTIGDDGGSNPGFIGYMEEVRITKGIARYTADFTPPTEPFPEEQNPIIPATAYFPTTDLIWHIDAASGVRTTGGALATNGQVVDSWDTQVGSANMSYITGTQGVYYSSGGPNNLPYVDTLGGQYDWTAQFAKTAIAMYKLTSNAINFPLQDTTFDIGSWTSYWAEFRSTLGANLCQVYDRGGVGFWWWGDRPGGGGDTTWFTFAPLNQWVITAMRINFGNTTNSIQIDSTRDRRRFNIFNGQICRAAAYSSILSNTDLAAIFQLWSIEAGIGLRNAVGNLSTILDRSEYI